MLGLLSNMKFIFMVKSWTLFLDVEIECHFKCQIIRIIRLLHSEQKKKKVKTIIGCHGEIKINIKINY